MDERVVQLRIGLMVLATAIITAILLTMFGGERTLLQPFRGRHVFHVQFPEASEVTPDTPVLKSGVRIGRVASVRLPEEISDKVLGQDVGAVVTIEIDSDRRIFTDEVCRIKRNLLGDAVLEFVRVQEKKGTGPISPQGPKGAPQKLDLSPFSQGRPQRKARKPVEPGAWLRGKVQIDPIELVEDLEADLLHALKSLAQTSDEIRDFTQRMSEFLGTREELGARQQQLDKFVKGAISAMDSVDKLAKDAHQVIGNEDLRRQMRHSLEQFPAVLDDARDTLKQMEKTLAGMDKTLNLANKNLVNVEAFTKPLGERGPVVIERLDQGAEKLGMLLDEMHTFSKALNSREGSLGRFVGDPELYERLNQTAANMEDLTRQLRPVVWNARVFSDKIARHPELLGVRGVLERSPGTKGVPSLSELQRTTYTNQSPQYPYLSQPR